MDDPNERIARLFDQLAEKHDELAELLESSTDPKHAESDKKLPEAERISAARSYGRSAASIRTRLNEKGA